MTRTGFFDLARHHVWATETLLDFCATLDDATLLAVVPGTYGSILDTLRHLVDSDVSYIYRLTGAWDAHPWRDDVDVDIPTLKERTGIAGAALIEFLDGPWDVDKIGVGYGDGGAIFEIPAGVFLTQTFHHANEHRAHVCTALGSIGIEPPETSAWAYSMASERSRQTN
jgi:uncharacterized damage-inducible protein DinB